MADQLATDKELTFSSKDVGYQSYLECRAAHGIKSLRPWLVRYFVVEDKHFTLRRFKDTTKTTAADSRIYYLEDLQHVMLIDKEGTRFTLRFRQGRSTASKDNHKPYFDLKLAAESSDARQRWAYALSHTVNKLGGRGGGAKEAAAPSGGSGSGAGSIPALSSLILEAEAVSVLLAQEALDEAAAKTSFFGRAPRKTSSSALPHAAPHVVESAPAVPPAPSSSPVLVAPPAIPLVEVVPEPGTGHAHSESLRGALARAGWQQLDEGGCASPLPSVGASGAAGGEEGPVADAPADVPVAVAVEPAVVVESAEAAVPVAEPHQPPAEAGSVNIDDVAGLRLSNASEAMFDHADEAWGEDIVDDAPVGAAAFAEARERAPDAVVRFIEDADRTLAVAGDSSADSDELDLPAADDDEAATAAADEERNARYWSQFTPEQLEELRARWRKKAWRVMSYVTVFMKSLERVSGRPLTVAEKRERLLKNMNHDTIKTRHSKGEKLKEFLA